MSSLRRWAGIVRSLVIYWRPGRQKALRQLYAPFIVPGELVFDVGAHVGDRTAAFADLGARVVALEPNPALLPWLRRFAGRRRDVTIVDEAVGAEEGRARLALSEATPTLSTMASEWRERIVRDNPTFRGARWDRSVEVVVTTLDHLIGRFGEPSFCKIDVEGHEAAVLEGLSRPLAAVSFEFVAGTTDVAVACVRRLEALGDYDFNVVAGEGRDFVHEEWMDADEVEGWLDAGAGGVSSGDVYARRSER
ncbi:MAG: FkbM family methyltransferase [Gemmatimonadetes bacterium]|nr:FkbM family methyltransferase [Gemmatimonadota bacterium]NNF12976.1 FkbM family methyltransferase [Gemmatimonadota bacterium]